MASDPHANPLPAAPAADELHDVLRAYMDVTGRLERTHNKLQDEVARLRAELASKNRELELRRRLAALGELAAGVAHEVRNPLGAIQLYSGLLRDQVRAHDLGPSLELLDKIQAGIAAIDAVVQDTLALAPRQQQLRACRIDELLTAAHDACAAAFAKLQVRLVLPTDGCAQEVYGDLKGLQRVLVNLMVNAAEVSQPGQAVQVEVTDTAEVVQIAVVDNGPGLSDELRERIFEPFFTTKEQGTGLGLTIAHRLVEAYGGQLSVVNRPERGAIFTVTLPRAEATAARQDGTGTAASYAAA